MDSSINVLIVEDDQNTRNIIASILASSGYTVLCAATGKKAISMAATDNLDLILLDLGLPDIDGIKVLKSIREWSDIPIIIVSARENEYDKVNALDSGANDYITKPFGNNELLARMRAVMRLQKNFSSAKNGLVNYFSSSGLVIDYTKRVVSKNNKLIHLTPIEYKIVVLLSQNAGRVLTHEFIIHEIWGPFESDSQTLRVNMANIRRKLEENPADPQFILTETRVGYKMIEPDNVLISV